MSSRFTGGCIGATVLLLGIGMGAFAGAGGQAGRPRTTVTVFAAASLTESLNEIGAAYEKETGGKLVLNLAGSSTLAQQIRAGAPADIFFSADEAKMQALDEQGLIVKGTRRSLLSNCLVIVVAAAHGAGVTRPQDLAGPSIQRIALGDPQAVPAGVYAREYLQKLKLWSVLARKVVPVESVRAALGAVEAGDAEAAIVYKTDAAISRKVRVAFEVPRESGPRISYAVALIKDAPHPRAARQFLERLCSAPAGAVFRKFGFIVLEHPGAPGPE